MTITSVLSTKQVKYLKMSLFSYLEHRTSRRLLGLALIARAISRAALAMARGAVLQIETMAKVDLLGRGFPFPLPQ